MNFNSNEYCFCFGSICVMLSYFSYELGRVWVQMLEVKVPLTFCSCLSFQALFFPSLIGLLFSGLFYGDQTHLSSMCNIGKTLWEASVFKVLGCEKPCSILSSCMKAWLFQSTKKRHYRKSVTEGWNPKKLTKKREKEVFEGCFFLVVAMWLYCLSSGGMWSSVLQKRQRN